MIAFPDANAPLCRRNWGSIGPRSLVGPNEYSIGSEHEQGAGALRLVRHDDGELVASRLRLADEPERRFSVATKRTQHDVQIFVRIGVVERFLEQRDTVWEQVVRHDDEPTRVGFLVAANQRLAFVPRRVMRLVQRAAPRCQLTHDSATGGLGRGD